MDRQVTDADLRRNSRGAEYLDIFPQGRKYQADMGRNRERRTGQLNFSLTLLSDYLFSFSKRKLPGGKGYNQHYSLFVEV